MGRIRLVVIAALAVGGSVLPGSAVEGANAVANGEFEVALPGKAEACAVAGDSGISVLPQDQNPHLPDPTSPGEELPWPWLASVNGCEAGVFKAATWSSSGVTQFGDVDGNGDREGRIDGTLPYDPAIGADHNLWHSYANAQQAFSGNFSALRFRVEGGSIPTGAYVQISFSTAPLEAQHPYVGIFVECSLTFGALVPNASGLVSRDPIGAVFGSYYEGCDETRDAFNAAGPGERRRILGRLRIVQVSFWRFQTGAPVVLDGVELADATTVAEELAAGNVRTE